MTLPPNATLEELIKQVNALTDQVPSFETKFNANQMWILSTGFLVIWMSGGFAMLETGSVPHKMAVNILFKNLATIAIGGVGYWLTGFAWAYGISNIESPTFEFIGSGFYALTDGTDSGLVLLPDDASTRNNWFFQYAFAATSATIVSGAVAGRCTLGAYFACASFLVLFVYPVVSHWAWGGGWAAAVRPLREGPPLLPLFFSAGGCGVIDFAGSGVVHLTGGTAALVGATILGPRIGRFQADGVPVENFAPHNVTIQVLGVIILWFGWYGFNCGSTLAANGILASKVAVTTTISASSALVTAIVISPFIYGHYDISLAMNSVLAGLVTVTAGCAVVPDWAAFIMGILACLGFLGGSKLVLYLQIDDPVDAIAVHGVSGIMGMLYVGIFAETSLVQFAYGPTCGPTDISFQSR